MKEQEEVVLKKAKCINLTYLKQRTKSNPVLMEEMIKLYLTQTPAIIKTIKESLANQNWHLVSAAAHKMIPSFAIVGISQDFENIAKQIQVITTAPENIEEIMALVQQLEEVCEQACSELEQELKIIKNTIK